MQRKPYLAVLALVLAVVAPFGCARPGEPAMLSSVRAVEDTLYVLPPAERAGEPTPEASLNEWLLYAEARNPGLEAAFLRWKAAAERIAQVRARPDPRLSYAYFLRSVETRVGPQQHSFAISQAFPWFGKLAARGDVALQAARSAEQGYEALRLQVFHAVTREYAQLYYLDRSIQITEETLELWRHWEEVARAKFRAGTGTHAAVVQAQVEIGVLTDRLRSLRDQRGTVLAALNAFLTRPTDAPIATPELLDDVKIALDDAELLDMVRGFSPELRAAQIEVERRRGELRLARKASYPDFTLGVGYIVTGPARNPSVEDSGKDPLLAQVSVNLPVWFGNYAAGRREAEASVRAAQLEHDDRVYALDSRVKRMAYELRDAARKVTLYRDTLIPKGDQSLRAASTAYEAGRLEFLNVIDAQRVLLEFQLAYERALSDQLANLAKLEALVGRRLPRTRE